MGDVLVTEGMDTYILAADDESLLRRFAEEVAPAVRELVAKVRADSPARGPARTPAESPARTPADAPPPPTAAGALAVTPTPPPAQRHSQVRVWDEATRPAALAPPPGPPSTS